MALAEDRAVEDEDKDFVLKTFFEEKVLESRAKDSEGRPLVKVIIRSKSIEIFMNGIKVETLETTYSRLKVDNISSIRTIISKYTDFNLDQYLAIAKRKYERAIHT